MLTLVQLKSYPVDRVLKWLLQDKSTKKNIIFATDVYGTDVKEQITTKVILGIDPYEIQPRVCKSLEDQSDRTRKKAEVFTPSWICNKMNNHCDEEWFGRKNVFNTEVEQDWAFSTEPIDFGDKNWQDYVESKRLEITCGEAPYIVSRYDTSTGKIIDIKNRIGILDRKLRVVNENTDNEKDWLEWVYKAYQSVYGYEFQGDNLLIARVNLLVTFVDYMKDRWDKLPNDAELKKITNIICWNIWQMDGMTGTVPYGKPIERHQQMSLFDLVKEDNSDEEDEVECRIYDWKANKSIAYKSLREGK
jgi:hypothetical protein